MTFLPIVERELRVASRRRATYWLRSVAALTVILVGVWFFLVSPYEARPHEMAKALFGILTGSSVLFALLSGVRSTADCLSEEKREGTLGLLFLTDLKGYDVVFGKLVATSLNAFYCVLAVLPMVAIPLLMGGVTLGEFGRTALVAVNSLFLSLAVGMYVSAMSRSARKAIGTTVLLLLFFTALCPALGGWLAYLAKSAKVSPIFLMPSAFFSYYLAWDTSYRIQKANFWEALAVIHGMAWLFLTLASLIAPRTWQDRPAGAQALRWRERWQLWSFGDREERATFRKRLLDTNAFFWLAGRARLRPAYVWAVLGLLGCCWVWGAVSFHRDWLNEGIYVTTTVLLHILIKGWFASEACRQLAEERQHGALELLLSTPLSVRNILRGQLLALRRQFLGPVLVVLLVEVFFMLAMLKDVYRSSWFLFWAGCMVTLIADLAALYWVGMWLGLTAKNPHRAATATVARVIVLPVIAFAIAMAVVAILSFRREYEPGARFFMALWFGFSLAADLCFAVWARQKLLFEFRQAAAQRYDRHGGFWKRLLARSGTPATALPPVIAVQE